MNDRPLKRLREALQFLPGAFQRLAPDRILPKFPPLLAELDAAAADFSSAAGDLEKRFLEIGAQLEDLSTASDRFVGEVSTLVGLATGKKCEGEIFNSAIQLTGRATEFLDGCQAETERLLRLLRDYHTRLEELLGAESDLQRTMLPLKVVQTLFKVESAVLGTDVQEIFCSLTQEIEHLHYQVRDIFGTKFAQLAEVRKVIGEVVNHLDQHSRSLHNATRTRKGQIEAVLGNLVVEMEANRERDLRVESLSKEIARNVGQVVVGLQIQDIVSQKLQHVLEALPQVDAKYAEVAAARGRRATARPMQCLHQISRLETSQVETAMREIAGAQTEIQRGIQSVLSHLGEADSQCLSLEEFRLLTTSFDGMVQVLLETIGEVRGLVSATASGAAGAYKLLSPLGSLASDLTATVRDLSARTHVVGLNAQIQAAHVAAQFRRSGLEALAARTSEICVETNQLGERAAERLDALASGLAECVAAVERMQADALAHQEAMREESHQEEGRLHDFRDRALESLRAIGDSLDQINGKAAKALEKVDFEHFHKSVLPALVVPLNTIAAQAESWLQREGI
ncbi:MAG TPA: hypothetical protein VHH73_04365, partial [Verrucomicrobiae bacterium]|nr:hypothetical protein [Verrucomicrobiae bacterium]